MQAAARAKPCRRTLATSITAATTMAAAARMHFAVNELNAAVAAATTLAAAWRGEAARVVERLADPELHGVEERHHRRLPDLAALEVRAQEGPERLLPHHVLAALDNSRAVVIGLRRARRLTLGLFARHVRLVVAVGLGDG